MYTLYKFHFLNGISEINQLFDDILIIWPAPVYYEHTKFTVTSEERINKSAVLYLFFFSYADTIPEDFETFRSQQIQLFWTWTQQFFFHKINKYELYISVMCVIFYTPFFLYFVNSSRAFLITP